METAETFLEQVTQFLNNLYGAPAGVLVILICIIAGYALKKVKSFPNDAIPIVVILIGAAIYPLIADDRNDITLRVWIVRNLGIGLILGFAAWVIHNKVIKLITDKFGTDDTTTLVKP